MRRRKTGSLRRGSKIYVLGPPPPRRLPVVDRSVPTHFEDYVRSKREGTAEDDWLPDDVCHPGEVGDVAAVVSMLDEVIGAVGEHDEHEFDNGDNGSVDTDDEKQPS